MQHRKRISGPIVNTPIHQAERLAESENKNHVQSGWW